MPDLITELLLSLDHDPTEEDIVVVVGVPVLTGLQIKKGEGLMGSGSSTLQPVPVFCAGSPTIWLCEWPVSSRQFSVHGKEPGAPRATPQYPL